MATRYITMVSGYIPIGHDISLSNYVTIGHYAETGEEITIGDIERRSGLYILGKPGMGKTTLLVNLMDQDIKNGHGVFFLDPHDGIDRLRNTCDSPRLATDLIELNIRDETHSFGINLLKCKNVDSWVERSDTYDRARWVFFKLFEKEFADMPWLKSIIQNTLYVFIENQEYTLTEVPLFLINPEFRNYLVSKVRYKPDVVDFWKYQFHPRQAESALTRITTLLGHDAVRHILGQRETTLDFAKIMEERRIVLVKLPATLAPDIKRFIGTILISELLHAVEKREEIPEDNRHQFCIFVDEFQHFVSYEDFGILITEARKFGIATTIAHQERFGQLGDNKQIIGATDATVNKILFQTTVRDAQEQAPEFAKPPPTEIREEQVLVISQTPVSYLLDRGHKNGRIRELFDKYLRSLQDRLDDIKGEIETGKSIRGYYQDAAALDRIGASWGAVTERSERAVFDPVKAGNIMSAARSDQYAALSRAHTVLSRVLDHSEELVRLNKSSNELRLTKRGLDRFLTAIMESRIKEGQEAFSAFLICLICVPSFALVKEENIKLLEIYISLKYGDPKPPWIIPFEFAKANGLFTDAVTEIQSKAVKKLEQEKEEFLEKAWKSYCQKQQEHKEYRRKERQECQEEAVKEINRSRLEFSYFSPDASLLRYMLLHEYPSLSKIFETYYTARFAPPWSDLFPDCAKTASLILDYIRISRESSVQGLEYFNWNNPKPGTKEAFRLKLIKKFYPTGTFTSLFFGPFFSPIPDSDLLFPEGESLVLLYEIDLLDGFERFIKQYGEGAIVVLVLLMTLDQPKRWRQWVYDYHFSQIEKEYNMLHQPTIRNREPLEIFLLLDKAWDHLSKLNVNSDCRKYAWECPLLFQERHKGQPRQYFQCAGDTHSLNQWPWKIKKFDDNRDMQLLKRLLAQSRNQLLQESWWREAERLVIVYLIARACHIYRYGQKVADLTYPLSASKGIKGATFTQVADMVAFMVQLQQEEEHREIIQIELGWLVEQTHIQKEFDKKFSNKSLSLPDNLTPLVLSGSELKALQDACFYTLNKNENAQAALKVIDEFIEFCTLLKQPENHIKVHSGQYVETQKPSRQVQDMEKEMAQELISLDPYYAYAKVLQREKGKMKTLQLPEPHLQGEALVGFISQIKGNTIRLCYVKERSIIEKEIRQRQEKWRGSISNEPPPTHSK